MEATRRRPKATYVYYVIRFDTPFEEMQGLAGWGNYWAVKRRLKEAEGVYM